MSFEADAAVALAMLQFQDFQATLPLAVQGDPAGPLLEPAVMAGADLVVSKEAQLAAILTDPEQGMGSAETGEALVAGLPEAVAAPQDARIYYDLAEADLALLPPDEDVHVATFDGLPGLQPEQQVIVVTGTRVRHYFTPSEPPSEPPVPGDVTVLEPTEIPPGFGDPDAGYHVYELLELGIKVRVPIEEWNSFTAAQRNMLFQVLNNYHLSTTLTAALLHLNAQGIESIVIRVGSHGW